MSEEHVVSGEQYRAAKQSMNNTAKSIGVGKLVAVGGVVVLCVLSFLGGTVYQKHHGSKTSATGTRQAGGFAGRGGFGGQRANGSMGSVTAVSATSITVNDQRSNSSKTYTIDNSTAITNNGATVATTDIKVGDTVFVSASSSTSNTATRILVNPSFGGSQGQQDQQAD